MDSFRLAEIDSEHTKNRVTLETLPIQRTGVPAHPDLQSAFARMNYLVVRRDKTEALDGAVPRGKPRQL